VRWCKEPQGTPLLTEDSQTERIEGGSEEARKRGEMKKQRLMLSIDAVAGKEMKRG
jgi:hypothetical protein